jgi:branched-chain amino acid transport system permease protein
MLTFLLYVLTLIGIYAIIAMSFNLAMGYTGLVNFGHIGLLGIGAYTSAILITKYDVSILIAALVSCVACAGFGALLAIPSRKIKDDYFALLTLGFVFLTQALFINWTQMTRGTLGIRGIPRPEVFAQPVEFFVLVAVVALVSFVFLDRVAHSPFGRVLEAIRDDDLVAQSLGKNVTRAKCVALGLSGFFVGIAGALFASFFRIINPSMFWLDPLVLSIAAVMVGGLASMRGSVLGVFIVFLFTESLRFVDIPATMIGPIRTIIFMAVLIAILLSRPKGILGRADLD